MLMHTAHFRQTPHLYTALKKFPIRLTFILWFLNLFCNVPELLWKQFAFQLQIDA